MKALRLYWLTTLLAAVLSAPPASAQPQSKNQRACIDALNKSAKKIGLQQGREDLMCLRDAANGKLDGLTAQECLTADRKNRMAKAVDAVVVLEGKKCSAEIPDFAYTDSATVIDAAQTGRLLSFADLFTAAADSAVIPCADDKPTCRCQKVGALATELLTKAKTDIFVSCKSPALKDGAASAADVAKCIDDEATERSIAADPRDKIQKAVARVAKQLDRTCDKPGVTLDAFSSHAFCSGLQGAALASCLDRITSCRVCQVLNRVDDLDVDCDLFDNDVADGSCSNLDICSPEGAMCDDGNACSVNDACTAVGCTGTQLVQGTAAAITKQITSIDAEDQVHLHVEIVTLTFNPFKLTATDVDHVAGLALETLTSVCNTPTPPNPYVCRHNMFFLAASACMGTGSYALHLDHSCDPEVSGCTLCGQPRTINFFLTTENWCDVTTVLPCGNGDIDFAEQCDGANLDGKTCVTQGYFGGTLACDGDCNFDTSGCDAARVFVTSTSYDGDLGGLSGADAECEARATAGSLGGVSWTAWLSSSSVDARERIPAVRYRTLNDVDVTSDGSNLYGGGLDANIDRDELNGAVSATVWTGTDTDGTKTIDHCSEWGADSGNGTEGTNSNLVSWTNDATPGDCSVAQRLYCFEGLPYKRVFVTNAAYTGDLGGLAGGDAKCQESANAAQLGGTWRAWLSTSTVDAKDRIPDVEYRLLDLDTVVATDKADLIDGAVTNNINLDELGVLRATDVWTGTNNDGTGHGGNCDDWTSLAPNILLGRNDQVTTWSNSGQIAGCGNSVRLYCFEE